MAPRSSCSSAQKLCCWAQARRSRPASAIARPSQTARSERRRSARRCWQPSASCHRHENVPGAGSMPALIFIAQKSRRQPNPPITPLPVGKRGYWWVPVHGFWYANNGHSRKWLFFAMTYAIPETGFWWFLVNGFAKSASSADLWTSADIFRTPDCIRNTGHNTRRSNPVPCVNVSRSLRTDPPGAAPNIVHNPRSLLWRAGYGLRP